MRLVIDTNVFVSLLIRPGEGLVKLAEYVERCSTLLYSTDTVAELVEVLRRQKFARYTTPEDVDALVRWVMLNGEMVVVSHDAAGSRDPDDNKFLSLALSGCADYLVSGDKDLLVLGRIGDARILSPSEFLAAVDN